ncbi:phage holin family protein [Timonella sp. A28]|uniref:phage holin family protein n=1 Tax=Timonella sp. A28 TaxID=3442640 RepID=UPI003EBA47B6
MFLDVVGDNAFPLISYVGQWLGDFDGLLYSLLIFVVADYISGVFVAINARQLSSAVGFRGISRKILIFALVGLAHLLDVYIIGVPGILRTVTILFYLANEGISLIENATRLGLPVPTSIREALDNVAQRAHRRPQPTHRKEKEGN